MAVSAQYRRHDPTETVLYEVVDDHWDDFKARVAEAGDELPRYVLREVEGYVSYTFPAGSIARSNP